MNEHGLTRKVSRWLGAQGDLWYFKVAGGPLQRPGIPDYIICLRGIFLAVELKHPNGSGGLTKKQEIERRRIWRGGGRYLVARSQAEVEAEIWSIRNEFGFTVAAEPVNRD